MKKIIGRMAREPSSWAGIAGLLGGLRVALPNYAGMIDAVIMVAGAIAVGMREKGGLPK